MQKKNSEKKSVYSTNNEKKDEKKENDKDNGSMIEIKDKSQYGDTLFFQIEEEIPTPIGGIGKFTPCLEVLPTYPSIVFFGKRRTGKSYGVRDLCYNCFQHIPFGIFFNFFNFFKFFYFTNFIIQ